MFEWFIDLEGIDISALFKQNVYLYIKSQWIYQTDQTNHYSSVTIVKVQVSYSI